MRLKIDGAMLSIDIDAEDLGDDDLLACCAEAAKRGLTADPGLRLRMATERALDALLYGQVSVASCVLQDALPPNTARDIVARRVGAHRAPELSARPAANGKAA